MRAVRQGRGFTLIEVMVSLVVLALAIVGSLSAVIATGRELKDGQTRQVRGLLGDASARRFMLAAKGLGSAFQGAAQPVTLCGGPCNQVPIGMMPWAVDNTTVIPGDLSTGAYFRVFGNGEVTQITPVSVPTAIPATTPCSGAIPPGVYCRETLITKGGPVVVSATGTFTTWPPSAGGGFALPATVPAMDVFTVWIRLSKKGDQPTDAIYFVDSFIQ